MNASLKNCSITFTTTRKELRGDEMFEKIIFDLKIMQSLPNKKLLVKPYIILDTQQGKAELNGPHPSKIMNTRKQVVL